jgi:hypothetical protein
MPKMLLVALLTLSATAPAAQGRSEQQLEGRWTGAVTCLHGGGDTVDMTITRDLNGRFSGSSDWALARSDGGKGPQRQFVDVSVTGRSLTARGEANGERAILRAALSDDGTLRGSWTLEGVDDQWTFVARSAPRR